MTVLSGFECQPTAALNLRHEYIHVTSILQLGSVCMNGGNVVATIGNTIIIHICHIFVHSCDVFRRIHVLSVAGFYFGVVENVPARMGERVRLRPGLSAVHSDEQPSKFKAQLLPTENLFRHFSCVPRTTNPRNGVSTPSRYFYLKVVSHSSSFQC